MPEVHTGNSPVYALCSPKSVLFIPKMKRDLMGMNAVTPLIFKLIPLYYDLPLTILLSLYQAILMPGNLLLLPVELYLSYAHTSPHLVLSRFYELTTCIHNNLLFHSMALFHRVSIRYLFGY